MVWVNDNRSKDVKLLFQFSSHHIYQPDLSKNHIKLVGFVFRSEESQSKIEIPLIFQTKSFEQKLKKKKLSLFIFLVETEQIKTVEFCEK